MHRWADAGIQSALSQTTAICLECYEAIRVIGEEVSTRPAHILRISDPGIERFAEEYVRRGIPVIITDIQDDWAASESWSLEFFRQEFGSRKVGTMKLHDGICDVDTYGESEESLSPLLEVIKSIEASDLSGQVLACSTELFGEKLGAYYEIPKPCKGRRFFRSRIYMGPTGVVTPLHQDLPENLYTLVKGRKRITLFHPDDSGFLYRNSIWHRNPNFSMVNPENPDWNRFKKYGRAVPYTIELNAGETLYIPSLWWHHFRNLETSIAMSFWWPEGWRLPLAWATAQYKRLVAKVVLPGK